MDWAGVTEGFARARRLGPAERALFLERLEPNVRLEVEDLLAHHEAPGAPDLESPLAGVAAAALEEGPPELEGFTVLRRLGEGGMGAVYEAEQVQPRRRVAVKVLRLPTAEARRRFEREAQVLARLEHPGIARIHAQGVARTPHGPCPCLVMELVDGTTLAEHARGLAPRARVELLVQVCDAVAHAHEKGVIHRDLKPGNILVTRSGEAKVLDFGLARPLDGASFQTRAGHVLGTLAYMSPEQALGSPDAVDTRSDVYALGVIAYEVLSGRLPLPLDGMPLPVATRALLEREPPPLPGRGDLPVIVAKALGKEKERRYSNAAALAEDLRRYLRDEPVLARPPTTRYQIRKFVRRHRALVGGVAATMAALAVGLVLALRFAHRASREEARARHVGALATLQAAAAAAHLGDAGGLRKHLEAVAPGERAWEWRHLSGLVDSSAAFVPVANSMECALDPGASRVLLLDWKVRPSLLDVETGRDVGLRFPPGVKWSRSVTFAGQAPILFERDDGGRRIADLSSGRLLDTDTGGRMRRGCAAGTRDGSMLAWVEMDPGTPVCRICLYSMRAERVVGAFPLPETPKVLAFSPDGARLACGGQEQPLRVVDVATREMVAEVRAHTQDVVAIAFDPTSRRVATASLDHSVEVRDATTGVRELRLVGHLAPVRCVAFSPEGRLVVSGASDETIRLWNARTGACERILLGHGAAVLDLGFRDAATLVSVGVDSIRRWDLDDSPILRHHASVEDGNRSPYVYGVAFSPDGTRLASCGWDGTARILDAATHRPLAVLNDPPHVLALAFSPDGRTLATACSHAVRLWDAGTGEQRGAIAQGAVHGLAWAPDSRRLAAASGWGGVVVYDAGTRKQLFRWRSGGESYERVAWSPDGSLLAHAEKPGVVALRRAETGEVVRRLPGNGRPVFAVAFSPDGRTLATAGWSATVRLWDVATGEERHRMSGHVGKTYALAFTPDGTRLASGGEDATIRLWDTATGEERLVLRGHERYVFGLAFSPDGATLASASGDNTVRLWRTRGGAR